MSAERPTTHEVRGRYIFDDHNPDAPAAFDRWLKSIEDAAWDHGWRAGPWGRRPPTPPMAEAWDEGYTRGFYAAQLLPRTADASEGAGTNPYEAPDATP